MSNQKHVEYVVVRRDYEAVWRVWRKVYDDDWDDNAVVPTWDNLPYPTEAEAQAFCDQLNQKVADRLAWFRKVKKMQVVKVTDRFGRTYSFMVYGKDKELPILIGPYESRERVDMVDYNVKMEIVKEDVK